MDEGDEGDSFLGTLRRAPSLKKETAMSRASLLFPSHRLGITVGLRV
jgi:hypothetical protein